MPYDVNADLPSSVRSHLPEHAQDIFREAFNHAYAAHAHDPRQEEAAFRIAWAAVKRQYEKIGDEWVEKGEAARLRLVKPATAPSAWRAGFV
jgi:cation transport regulator